MDDVQTQIHDGHDLASDPAPEPLRVLARWPTACRANQDCEISGVCYPAPNDLCVDDLEWWIDVTEIRVNASRNLLNGSVSAVLGGLVGAAVATATGWVSASPWVAALVGAVSVLVVVLVGRLLLRDSDHSALE